MKCLAVVMQKGGVGKSTIVRALAIAALVAGKRVGVVDMDPQGSVAKWAKRRSVPAPTVVTATAATLPDELDKLAKRGAEVVLIDTPPHTMAAVQVAAEHAAGVILPVKPYPDDLDALPATVQIIRDIGRPAVLVINAAPARAQASAQARAQLARLGLPVLPHDIVDRITHPYATANGQTAQEYEPKGKAAAEVAAAWEFVAATFRL